MIVDGVRGTAVYQLLRYGVYEIEWTRVLFIAVATFTALLLVPQKSAKTPSR